MKKNIDRFVCGILLFLIFFLGGCKEDGINLEEGNEIVYKVAVVMPGESQTRWERIASWALGNLEAAQTGMQRCIKLQLEWKNENDSDLEDYLRHVANDPEIKAVIGPYKSASAKIASLCCGPTRKTLILPTASSVELQRSCAGKGFMWALSESDISQCEILLTQARLNGAKNVYLLAREDDYGQSFNDWFGFQTVELGLNNAGMYNYESPEQMLEALKAICCKAEKLREDDIFQTLIFTPSVINDVVWLDSLCNEYPDMNLKKPWILCSDVAYSATLPELLSSDFRMEGIALSAEPASGFSTAYRVKYGEESLNGEAHLYDAFMLLFYGLAVMQNKDGITLNEALCHVVDGREPFSGSWMRDDIRQALNFLYTDVYPDLSGVTGNWNFDRKVYTSVLNSTYVHWSYDDKYGYYAWEYLSADGSRRTSSTLASWNWHTATYQSFDPNMNDVAYPPLQNKWCVLVASSEGWSNYRHQADVYAMYQLMKRHGYTDDHIILIAEDDIAYNENNIYPGVVRVHPNGENVYAGVKIDYRLHDIEPENLEAILLGDTSERLPQVIHAGENDNVLIFWSGHGLFNKLNWGNGYKGLSASQLRNILEKVSGKKAYRKLFFAIEACYSGSMASYCEGIPGVLFMTAANAGETSKADIQDYEMNIWLSNGFTRAFQETIDKMPAISLRDFYYKLARNTVGSHVSVYNEHNYGNIYRNTMEEFLQK